MTSPIYPAVRNQGELRKACLAFLEGEVARAKGSKRQSDPLHISVSLARDTSSLSELDVFTVVAMHVSDTGETLALFVNTLNTRQFVVVDPFEDLRRYRVSRVDTRLEKEKSGTQLEAMTRLLQ
jgi:hypothetical protein